MKTLSKTLVAGSLLLVCGVAAADMSYNVGLTSDYRFRGISQSGKDPAIQGGADFTDKSGIYLGIWGSTIDFGPGFDADLEVDLYGGYKWKAANIEWDAGLIHYAYPGSVSSQDLPFTELYIGGTYGPVNVKYYYTDDAQGTTSDSAYYLVAGSSVDLGSGYSLGFSLGYTGGDAVPDSFYDYKVGVSKEFGGFGFNLSYIGVSGIPDIKGDFFNTEDTIVLTVTKTF